MGPALQRSGAVAWGSSPDRLSKGLDMNQEFTVGDFINNRWADAKQELLLIDADFVNTVEAYRRASDLGLSLPNGSELPTPAHRLPARWHNLLAATTDVVHELDNLNLNVSLMDAGVSPGIDRRLAVYHFEVWVQHVFNLCDKVRRQFVTLSCRQYFAKKKWKERADYYNSQIKLKVQDEIEEFRSGLVHGVGGKGTLSQRVITDQFQGWEICVVGGPWMIDEIRESSYQGGQSADYFARLLPGKTEYVVQTLGAILAGLEREITLTKQ